MSTAGEEREIHVHGRVRRTVPRASGHGELEPGTAYKYEEEAERGWGVGDTPKGPRVSWLLIMAIIYGVLTLCQTSC